MSALGQKRTSRSVERMSALPPKADIGSRSWNVRFVPKADILRCDKKHAISITSSARALLCFDAGGLDNWPPLGDFGFLQCAERLWGLLLARDDLGADLFDPRAQCRISQALNDGGIDFADHGSRRTFRRPNAGPD